MMGFQEFWKQKERMCNYVTKTRHGCSNCDIGDLGINDTCNETIIKYPKEAEEIVQKWASEHPIQTNADKFKEVFGFRPNYNSGVYETFSVKSLEWNQEYIPPESVEK